MTCIGPWEEVGLYFDAEGDDAWDIGSGVGGGVEYDRCTFGFTAQTTKDGNAKGQIQFVDHTQGIVLHCSITKAGSLSTGPKGALYYAQWRTWLGEEPPGTITLPDGSIWPLDAVCIEVTTHRWALMDQTGYDPVTYPQWPYLPIIEEGYGDAICVWALYADFDGNVQWVGVVEKGNLTTHKK